MSEVYFGASAAWEEPEDEAAGLPVGDSHWQPKHCRLQSSLLLGGGPSSTALTGGGILIEWQHAVSASQLLLWCCSALPIERLPPSLFWVASQITNSTIAILLEDYIRLTPQFHLVAVH